MNKYKDAEPRGSYIPAVLAQHCRNGDAYIMIEDAYLLCTGGGRPYEVFRGDLAEQVRLGNVHREGRRLYLTGIWNCENSAADHLADILLNNTVECSELTEDTPWEEDIQLSEEQLAAVHMALSHRLSVILGGAGTGKTTLIRQIVKKCGKGIYVLAAPTGRAAKNLNSRTGLPAETVHSALGLHPDSNSLSSEQWEHTSLVVIDEASMLTLELLAGLLCRAKKGCRVVLVGDPEQLLSVGSGNVLPDLLALGIPCARLQQNFRQTDRTTALYDNVVGFPQLQAEAQLRYDDSFRLEQMDELAAEKALVEEAVRRQEAGERVLVLSPYNSKTRLSVRALNSSLQERLNPPHPWKLELLVEGILYRSGDRVIMTKNAPNKVYVNGDTGILRVDFSTAPMPTYHVELDNGSCIQWAGWEGLKEISLAYALTVHKSQGSQYDTVLFPVVERFSGMLYRNLLYTAVSRATEQVILYGSRSVLDAAIRRTARPRRSMLVTKTGWALQKRRPEHGLSRRKERIDYGDMCSVSGH